MMNGIKRLIYNNCHSYSLLRRYTTKIRKPINPEDADQLPVFKYPSGKASDRRVYVWGQGETGALGLHVPNTHPNAKNLNLLKYSKYPRRMTFAELSHVTDITTGYGFTVLAVDTPNVHKVFGTGLNTDSQIGHHSPRREGPLQILLAPVPIRLPIKNPQTTQVLGLSAGRAHLVVVTDEGVFTLGNNAYGQCGRRVVADEDYHKYGMVHHIKQLGGEKIVQAECGQDHSMFITESGNVFACGWGSDGQLGRGCFETDSQPQLVTGDIKNEKITKISCTADCVLALSESGDVFGWGNTEYGQLASSNAEEFQVNVPRYLQSCKGLGKIVDVASGGSFCCVVNDKGDVFTWGFGLLGQGPNAQQSFKPVKIPNRLFGRNEFSPNTKVTKVFCGMSHFAAVTQNGDLYTWGKNKFGSLGLGELAKDQNFPLKVAVGAEVIKVSCGIDHTVALCKPFT